MRLPRGFSFDRSLCRWRFFLLCCWPRVGLPRGPRIDRSLCRRLFCSLCCWPRVGLRRCRPRPRVGRCRPWVGRCRPRVGRCRPRVGLWRRLPRQRLVHRRWRRFRLRRSLRSSHRMSSRCWTNFTPCQHDGNGMKHATTHGVSGIQACQHGTLGEAIHAATRSISQESPRLTLMPELASRPF